MVRTKMQYLYITETYSEMKLRSEIYDKNEWGDFDNEILMMKVANSSNKETGRVDMGEVLFKILEKGKKSLFEL
jgi:hypothetical protein